MISGEAFAAMEEIAFAATPVTMLQYLHGASVDAAQHPSDTLKEDRDAGREQGDGKTATAKEAAMKADPASWLTDCHSTQISIRLCRAIFQSRTDIPQARRVASRRPSLHTNRKER
ncbi:hypothetical protein DPSP01_011287 [Paraphaeosphaeria sporulosa]